MVHRYTLSLAILWLVFPSHAQQRYVDEVFSNAQITVTPDVEYSINIDFMRSLLNPELCPNLMNEIVQLQTIASQGGTYPQAFLDTDDENTCIKLSIQRMDVYAPNAAIDACTSRPVVIFLHNGALLPPCVNGLPLGERSDSLAVEFCMRMARRGYTAISVGYRLGWNPLSNNSQELKHQLLNAVYRAMHDTKMAIRHVKRSADEGDPYGIDPDRIVLVGQGTGAYISLATATLDREEELFTGQLLDDPFAPTSFIDMENFGGLDGFGGTLNLYRPNGYDANINLHVNISGGIVDTTWIEPGDVPMLAVHCVRDEFNPFNEGPVYNPFGLVVVQAYGSNKIIRRANELGNNTAFTAHAYNDPFTAQAQSLYGTTWSTTLDPPNVTVVSGASAEGLFPFILELQAPWANIGQPWQWWDPAGPYAACHSAGVGTNPHMSPSYGRTYVDTIIGYITPRMANALNAECVGMQELLPATVQITLHPNPATEQFTISTTRGRIHRYEIYDITGSLLRTGNITSDRAVLERKGLASGIYLIHLYHTGGTAIRRMLLE
jgi:acetyl esterase/lipase